MIALLLQASEASPLFGLGALGAGGIIAGVLYRVLDNQRKDAKDDRTAADQRYENERKASDQRYERIALDYRQVVTENTRAISGLISVLNGHSDGRPDSGSMRSMGDVR